MSRCTRPEEKVERQVCLGTRRKVSWTCNFLVPPTCLSSRRSRIDGRPSLSRTQVLARGYSSADCGPLNLHVQVEGTLQLVTAVDNCHGFSRSVSYRRHWHASKNSCVSNSRLQLLSIRFSVPTATTEPPWLRVIYSDVFSDSFNNSSGIHYECGNSTS